MAEAFRQGNLGITDYHRMQNLQAEPGCAIRSQARTHRRGRAGEAVPIEQVLVFLLFMGFVLLQLLKRRVNKWRLPEAAPTFMESGVAPYPPALPHPYSAPGTEQAFDAQSRSWSFSAHPPRSTANGLDVRKRRRTRTVAPTNADDRERGQPTS
jgi:hypothetical protein